MQNSRVPLPTLLYLLLAPLSVAQEQTPQQLLEEVDNYRAQLEDLEQQVDRYDFQLLEPLQGLAGALIDLDQIEEASTVLDRAIQVVRFAEGLYTPRQLPFLVLTIRNDVRRGNWDDANETLEHVTWLYTNKNPQLDSDLVYELMQLSNLHLEGVVGDLEERRSHHFRTAEAINRLAIRVGEEVWSESDLRLAELYYHLAINHYLQAAAVIQGGEAAADLRQVVPGSGRMLSREEMNRNYYRTSVEILARMRRIYETADPPDREAMAMVDVYLADWQVLFDEGGATTTYQQAYNRLAEAGVSQRELQLFFSRPRVLPVTEFYPSLALAQEALDSEQAETDELRFLEWSSAFPNIRLPLRQPLFLLEEVASRNNARLTIELDGVERVGRWAYGRYVTQISVPSSLELLDQTPAQAITQEELEERLHFLNFRPVLDNGIPRSFEGTLEYQYFPRARE